MKPLAEGFRVYSRSTPARELRPPKSSLAKASGEGRSTRRNGFYAWIALASLAATAGLFLFAATS